MSRPSSGVAYIGWVSDWTLDLFDTFNSWLQFTVVLLPIHITAYSSLQTHWVLFVCCPSPVLWYRLPMADSQCTHWNSILNCLLLSPTVLSGAFSNNLLLSKSKLYYDRQSVLVSRTHLGPATNFSHSLFDYFFRQFRVSWCGAPSLSRNRVCTFQFLPGIASTTFLRSSPMGLMSIVCLTLLALRI
jgi:hypothetical protein